MTPKHHPQDEWLVDYAAGTTDEPLALVIASHLAFCPGCRDAVARLEAAGGSLLDECASVEVPDGMLERVMACLDEGDRPRRTPAPAANRHPVLPAPLQAYVGTDLDALPWRRLIGLSEIELLRAAPAHTTRLMRITPGTAMPRHTHGGVEMTLVLDGAFSDGTTLYQRGDIAFADTTVDHSPVAAAGDECLCLAVTSAPLRLTGPLGRYLNPFIRF